MVLSAEGEVLHLKVVELPSQSPNDVSCLCRNFVYRVCESSREEVITIWRFVDSIYMTRLRLTVKECGEDGDGQLTCSQTQGRLPGLQANLRYSHSEGHDHSYPIGKAPLQFQRPIRKFHPMLSILWR